MKVLFISGREPTYIRNSVILKGLNENDVEVVYCTSLSMSYLFRYPIVLLKLLLPITKHNYNIIFIGFFGQPLVPIIKMLTNKPIILDAFLSAYDTMCFDRKRFKPNSLGGRFFYWLDKHSCEIADKVLLDTDAHIDYFTNTFDLENKKFQRVFVGADDSIFYPRDVKKEDSTFRVFYYGTYRPLHGIEYIIRAAKKLESYEDIEFEIVGKGPEHEKIMRLVEEIKVKNINFIDWIPYKKLPLEITKADICLGGHFSSVDKAKRTIAGKTFQFIAMKKPVIVGDNPANRELFENKKNVLLVEHANANSLAKAILELKEDKDLREKIAEAGYKTFREWCRPEIIGREIKSIIENIL